MFLVCIIQSSDPAPEPAPSFHPCHWFVPHSIPLVSISCSPAIFINPESAFSRKIPNRPDTHSLVVSQAPSVCSTRLKGEPNGFHLLTLSPREIEIELWRWGSDRFLPERSRTFFTGPDGWETE